MSRKIDHAREDLMAAGRNFLLQNREGRLGRFNIRDITTECNMALGTFYRYFKSRDDLARQILADDWETVLNSVDTVLRGEGTLYEKVKFIYEQVSRYDNTYRLSAMELFAPTKENLKFMENVSARLTEKLKLFLQTELDRGDILLDARLDSAAYLLTQLFFVTGRNPAMDFEELWKCMNFKDLSLYDRDSSKD